jgi:hypothetical protein
MSQPDPYQDFIARLKLLIRKHPALITTTLSNIFTMRLLGNKTHGDLAEIAMAEFINQYMYDFRSVHVGKDLYRAKAQEEDIKIINEITQTEFPVSLKAYGIGPLQLSTDKTTAMFPLLQQAGTNITDRTTIEAIFRDPAFAPLTTINILPLIYDESAQRCNILVFASQRAQAETARITLEPVGKSRKHPVYRFYNATADYICEVRYGGATANALQRGLWTHTKNAPNYFDSLTDGWLDYAHNQVLVSLFSHALVATSAGHTAALALLQQDIAHLKQTSGVQP